MMLKALQCTGQPLAAKNYPDQKVNSSETEKSVYKKIFLERL